MLTSHRRPRPERNNRWTKAAFGRLRSEERPNDGGTTDPYTGLDRFGRVVEVNWYNTSTSSSTDDFQYGYDQDGNVLYKNNTPA